jgi:hypothetical protein
MRFATESRAAEMVWRARNGDTAASPQGTGDWPAASRPAPQVFDTTPDPMARASDKRAVALDPALAERLADDVIRRIDRRARIERERRGL